MFTLRRLKIHRFRKVRPGTELHFGPGITGLLGKNATGKTTLLDLIAAVTNDDLSPFADEPHGFKLEWTLAHQDDELVVVFDRAERGKDDPENRSSLGADDRFEIELRTGGASVGHLKVSYVNMEWHPAESDGQESAEVLRSPVLTGVVGRATAFGMSRMSPTERGQLPQLLFSPFRGARVPRLDEALECFAKICGGAFSIAPLREGVSQMRVGGWTLGAVIDEILGSGWPNVNEVEFKDVGSGAANARRTTGDAADASMFADEPIQRHLSTIPDQLGFSSGWIVPRAERRTEEDGASTVFYSGLDFRFVRKDGSYINQNLLSFGQKRFFSFLWYLAARRELPLVLDELGNGLHYEWIETAFQKMRGRQVFLATQHPFLLDHVPIETVEDVQASFVRCSTDPSGQMVWRNLDADEARRLYDAYQVGIQQLSEVLRMEDLW